ncbi:ER membrane protein complex subunit 4 [Balamuthia mandrillaris]
MEGSKKKGGSRGGGGAASMSAPGSSSSSTRKWAFNLNNNDGASAPGGVTPPLGFGADTDYTGSGPSNSARKRLATDKNALRELKKKRAWELGTSPAKSIFMTMFMVWMTGNSVNIFSIMIALFTLINPLKSIFQTRQAFSRFSELGSDLILPQLAYIGLHLLTLSIGAYKCYNLGVLPTEADLAAALVTKEAMEVSGGGLAFSSSLPQ